MYIIDGNDVQVNELIILIQIVHEALQNYDDPADGRTIAKPTWNRTFHLRYSDVVIDKTGKRRSNYCLSDFNVTTRTFEVSQKLLSKGG